MGQGTKNEPNTAPPSRLRRIAEILALAVLYALLARVGQSVAIPPGNVTAVWIPSGLVVAALLVRGIWLWPGVFLGAFVGNAWAYFDPGNLLTILAGAANGAGDAGGAVLAVSLLRPATATARPLDSPRNVGVFLAYGVVLSSAVSAAAGVLGLCLSGVLEWSAGLYTASTWFTGDAVGVLVLAPMLLSWTSAERLEFHAGEFAAFVVLLVTTSLVSLDLLPLERPVPVPLFALVPAFAWSVFRIDDRVTFTAVLVVAALSVFATATGHGPLAGTGLNVSLLQLQVFLAAMAVTILLLHASVAEKRRSRSELRALNADLEERVEERTAQLRQELKARQAVEHERLELEQRLRQTQKLESLGALAGGIAHDFNNLLVPILGNAHLLLQLMPPDDPHREEVGEIVQASERAAELATSMLAYSGKAPLALESLDLNELVSESAGLLTRALDERVALRFELEPDLPLVEADRTRLRQLLMNLVINAGEAVGPDSGEVVVRTRSERLAPTPGPLSFLPSVEGELSCIAVDVLDDGGGMDTTTVERMFDPFFSTKFTGRGLGMATVLGVARSHHGAIRISSRSGEGTLVTFLLPVGRSRTSQEPAVASTAPGLKPLHILLVDDEPEVLTVGRRILEWDGHAVRSARDGVEAVAAFADDPAAFDCVVLDLAMPRMDGEETLRELRRLGPDVPVVVASGYVEDPAQPSIAGLTEEPRVTFVAKPYTLQSLRAALLRVLGESAVRDLARDGEG